ncbi:MAG: hypothetical protein ACI9W4_002242 [Rhodothermales bacterium]|jgi:hypothetical protein
MSLQLLAASLIIWAVVAPGAVTAQRFVEATGLVETRVSGIQRPVNGGAVIDFNSDGLMDVHREGLLQRQRPDGQFENLGQSLGLDDLTGRTEGSIWADYNNDGHLDFFVIDALRAPRLFQNSGRWLFNRTDRSMRLQGLPSMLGATWLDADADGWPDLAVTGVSGTQLHVNGGPGAFNRRVNRPDVQGCGLSAYDYSGDGTTDLYVSACSGTPFPADAFLNNGGSGFFQLDGGVMASTNTRFARGSEFLDFDRDGDLDLFVANEIEEPFAFPRNGQDRLFRNNGDGTFSAVQDSGAEGQDGDQAWGVAAADFDNDGWVDILVTNRFATDISAASYKLFRNQGDGTFALTSGTGLPTDDAEPRGVPLVGDLNGDGTVDIYFAAELGDRLFYNRDTENHFLRVRLRGLTEDGLTPTQGLGARLVVWTQGTGQAGYISGGSAHASQHNGLAAHFGLGTSATADSVVVTWVDGSVDRWLGLPADREVILEQGGASASKVGVFGLTAPAHDQRIDLSDGDVGFSWEPLADPSGQPVTYDLTIAGPAVDTTFTGLTTTALTVSPGFLLQQQTYFWTVTAHTRFEVRTSLERRTFRFGGANAPPPVKIDMPLKALLSGQLAFADYDNDGDLDLALTGTDGFGGEARVYAAVDTLIPDGEIDIAFKVLRDTQSILREVRDSHVSWVDYDSDGDLDLFLAGYFQDIDGVVSVEAELYNNGLVLQQSVQASAGIPGVHQGDGDWADFDGDGDMDLLLSGATTATAPWAPMTDVIVNNGGTFVPLNAGMTGARFSRVAWVDYDTDGDPDAVVMGQDESGAPRSWAYQNNGGSFSLVDLGLPALYFSSMSWADYDGDGDPDLVMNGAVVSPSLFSGRAFIFRNDNGSLTSLGAERDLAQVGFGDVVWVDYDLDGDLDVLLSGVSEPFGERIATVYRNEDNVRFAEEFRLAGVLFAGIAAGDYNNDGDQDVILIGEGQDGKPSVLFLVNLVRPETIPDPLLQ